MKGLVRVGITAGLLGVALLISFLVLAVPPVQGFRLLWEGSFGGGAGLWRTVLRATPLVLTGAGLSVAWRAGTYNIGGEGQYLVGGLCAAAVIPFTLGMPIPVALAIGTIAAIGGGSLLAALAGVFEVKRGVPTTIGTILLNVVAGRFADWAIRGPLQEPTGKLPSTLQLSRDRLFPPFVRTADANVSIFLALAAAGLLGWWLRSSAWGFRIRAAGSGPEAAATFGVPVARAKVLALGISGGFCGLAAATEYLGVAGTVDGGFSQGWGFAGISVALLADLDPWVCVPVGFLLGALYAGSDRLASLTQDGPATVLVVQAIAVAALVGYRAWRSRR